MYTYIYTCTHTFIVQCIGCYGQQSGMWYEGSSAETIFGCESAAAGAPMEEFDRTHGATRASSWLGCNTHSRQAHSACEP